MAFDLGSLLQPYIGGGTAPTRQRTEAHFDQAAQNAPADVLSNALSAMLHADQTPAFGQMAGQMFGQANPNQRAGMLNSMIASMGPAVPASLLNKGGSGGGAAGGLGSLLGRLTGSGATPTITPDQASQLTPDQVQVIATHAEQANRASSSR